MRDRSFYISIISLLVASLLSGAMTWVYTMANIVTREDVSKQIANESSYEKDKKEIYSKLESIQESLKEMNTDLKDIKRRIR